VDGISVHCSYHSSGAEGICLNDTGSNNADKEYSSVTVNLCSFDARQVD